MPARGFGYDSPREQVNATLLSGKRTGSSATGSGFGGVDSGPPLTTGPVPTYQTTSTRGFGGYDAPREQVASGLAGTALGGGANAYDPRREQAMTASYSGPVASGSAAGGNANSYGPSGGSTGYFGGQSPWTPVTGGITDVSGNYLGQIPLANQPTAAAANQVGSMFGANVYQQSQAGASPAAGPLSQPLYGLDFGAGDLLDPAFIITALERGDRPETILARIQASIAPAMGQGASNRQFYEPNALSTNLAPGAVSMLGGGRAPIPASSPFAGLQPATNMGPIGGARPATQPANAPSQSAYQAAFAPWLQPNVANGASNRPFYAPMALGALGGQQPGTQYNIVAGPSGFTRWQGNYSVPFLGQSDWMTNGQNPLYQLLAQLLSGQY